MHLICCEVFRPELEWLAARMSLCPTSVYLEQGLHDRPEELKKRLQEKIDFLEKNGEERIILGYGLCGRSLTGVFSRRATLLMPRAHDCISVLLDSGQGDTASASLDSGTFWMSPGWLRYAQLPFMGQRQARHEEYEKLYGKDNADFLMEQERQWLANYTNACLIYQDDFPDLVEVRRDAQMVAADRGLQYREARAGHSWLLELLEGKSGERMLELAPGYTPDIDADGNIIAVKG